jgi:signal transduction histidine kinase/DNA-binding response OmpR family regulator/predicted RNA-binding protein with RPS1 domain
MNNRSYAVNQRVQGKIEKVLPFGIFVLLSDGTKAYIRRREMSWSGDIAPCELAQVGETIEAAVFDPDPAGQRLELSLRPLLPDPWLHFCERFCVGDRVEGKVKDILSHGIYVEILPGVDGYVPLAELSSWTIDKPDDIVWLSDHVEAIITYINPSKEKRIVRLSLRRRLQQLSLANSFVKQLTMDATTPEIVSTDYREKATEISLKPGEKAAIGLILILEDQDKLRNSLVKWLRRQGLSVKSAASTAAALKIMQTQTIGVCFVDIDLPDSDGLSFVRQLHQQQPDAHVILMSIPDWLAERVEEIETLAITAVLLKPLDLSEITSLLGQIGRGQNPRSGHTLSNSTATVTSNDTFQTLSRTMRSHAPLAKRLHSGLEQLLRLTNAEVGLVFHMDTASQMISIVAEAGATTLINQEATYALPDSPVKDVIYQQQLLFVNEVSSENVARFQKLQTFLPFEAAIGLPIPVAETTEHALFIFHRRPKVFSQYRLRDMQAMATLFAVALENQALADRLKAVGSIFLSGQLAAGLGHEVFNKISALEIQLLNLHSDYKKLVVQIPEVDGLPEFRETRQALDDIIQTATDLKSTVGLFQSLMRSDEAWQSDISQVLLQVRMQMLPLLNRDKVHLKVESTPGLPAVPGSPVHLRQLFLNILLNATQHIATKPSGPREIEITTTCDMADGERPLKIRITDTGPGIHKKLWQAIFNLGFSTRAEGTGLGLYIARSLVEHRGGSISVEKSVIPLGTTFLVELGHS